VCHVLHCNIANLILVLEELTQRKSRLASFDALSVNSMTKVFTDITINTDPKYQIDCL
jgi:hypothetical protein